MFTLVAEVDTGRKIGLWRQKLAGHIFRIGRSWDNDLVIDDPYVDAYHLEIVATFEGFWVRDLKTLNGTQANKKKLVDETFFIDELQVKMGQTKIRFVNVYKEIEKTKLLKENNSSFKHSNKVWFTFFWMIIAAQYLILEAGFFDQEDGWLALVWIEILLNLWAGFWTFIAKVMQIEIKWWDTKTRLAKMMSLGFAVEWLFSWGQSWFLANPYLGLVESALSTLIVVYYLTEQINAVKPPKTGDKKRLFLILALAILFIWGSEFEQKSSSPSAPVLPWIDNIAPSIDSEHFLIQSEELFDRALKQEKRKEP